MKKVLHFLVPLGITIVIFLISLAVQLLLINILSISTVVDIRNIKYVYAMSLTALVTCICVWFVYKYVHKIKLKEMGIPYSKNNVYITMILFIIMTIGFILYVWYANNILEITKWGPKVEVIYIIQILLLYLGVSINEEVLFRGYLHKFYKRNNIFVAYLISIPLFLLPHFLTRDLSITYLIALFGATLMLTLIYDLSGSIWPGIILHFVLNVYLSLVSLGQNSGTLIVLNNFFDYDRYLSLLRYSETIINLILIVTMLLFYIIIKRKLKIKNLFHK